MVKLDKLPYREMEIGTKFEAPHVCIHCSAEFTMPMYHMWYIDEPGVDLPVHLIAFPECPKCHFNNIARVLPDGSYDRYLKNKKPVVAEPSEAVVEPGPAGLTVRKVPGRRKKQ